MEKGDSTRANAPTAGARSAEGFLVAIQRALAAWVLYSPEHPAVRSAVRQAAAHLAPLFTGHDTASFSVARDHILWKDARVGRGDVLSPLAGALRACHAASVRITSAASERDLAALVDALGQTRRGTLVGPDFFARVREHSEDRIRVNPLAYDTFALAVGPGTGGRSGATRVSWPALVKSVVADPTHDPSALARAAEGEWELQGAGAAEDLWRELEAADDLFRTMQVRERIQALRRLNTFLRALSPRLREALASAPHWRERSAVSLLLDLGALVQINDVLDAIKTVDEHSQTPMQEVLLLFHTLARTAQQGGPVREQIEQMERVWMQAAAAEQPGGDLKGSLQEILETHHQADFSPGEHREQIARMAREGPTPTAPSFPPTTAENIRNQALEMCAMIASSEPDAARRCPGLFTFTAASADALIDSGRLESLVAVAEGGRRCAPPDPAQPAAHAFLADLAAPSRVERLVGASRQSGSVASHAQAVLLLAGPAVLADAVRCAGIGDHGALGASLRTLATGATDAQLAATLAQLNPRDTSTLESLLALLGGQPVGRVGRIFDPLLRHADPGVRYRAFRVLGRLAPAWPSEAAQLGLKDSSERIQRLTVERLARSGDDASLDMLASSVEEPGADRKARFDPTVGALIESGAAGLCRLVRALSRLRTGVHPARARHAARLARALEPHRTFAEVDRELRRWRRSPGRWIAALLPNGTAAVAEGAP